MKVVLFCGGCGVRMYQADHTPWMPWRTDVPKVTTAKVTVPVLSAAAH